MAKFLTTSGVTYHLEELIKGAQVKLYLISPYLKFNSRIREFLDLKAHQKACDIRVIYGKTDLRPEESEWLNDSAIRTSFCDNLHAKCYLNEDVAIVTSMNLYDFSQQNNNEMGILVRRTEDEAVFQELLDEAQRLLQISTEIRVTVEEVEEKETAKTSKGKKKDRKTGSTKNRKRRGDDPGYCIGCGEEHPFNSERPLCYTCYRNSARGKQLPDWEDRYCHACGDDNSSTLEKPLCYSCFKELAA